jgi:hypothetical protein
LVGSCCPQRASAARGASALAGCGCCRLPPLRAAACSCPLPPAPAALALPLPRPRCSCLLSPRSSPAPCAPRAAVHASDVNHLFANSPLSLPLNYTPTPHILPLLALLALLFALSPLRRPFPSQSLTLRTQHLSHPRPLSRCASHFSPFTPLPGLQIHCPAMDLLSCPLLLRPQFFGMTPLTCHFMLLLCAAADSICASLFTPFRYSSPSLSRSLAAPSPAVR